MIATKGPWYVFYFLFVIFLGPFYLINLVLAVVSLSYEQETAALQDEVLRVSEVSISVSQCKNGSRDIEVTDISG